MAVTVASLQALLDADTRGFDRAMTRSEKRFATVGRNLQSTGRTLTHALTIPIVAAAAVSVKLAVDFEASMTKIIALVGISRKQVNAWSEDILALAPEVGKSPQELGDALYFVASAGFRGEEAFNILRISAMAAATGLGETKDVADALTSAINAYGIETLGAREGTNTLIAAVTQGKMPVDALSSAIGQVLGVASEVGISFQEVAGTAAALSRVGAPVNRTMTGIRFLLTALIKPSSAGAAALKDVGLSVSGVAKSLREEGLLATLTELKKRLPIRDFLQVVGGARGVITALGLVGKNAKQANKVMENVKKTNDEATTSLHHLAEGATMGGKAAQDELGRAFDVIQKDKAFQLQKAMETIRVSAIKLGEALAPVFVNIANSVKGVFEWFNKLSPAGQNLVKTSLLLLAVLGPLLSIFGKAILLVTRLSMVMRVLGIESLLTQSIILLIPLALIAIGLAFIYAYKKSETFRTIVNAVFDKIKLVVGFVVRFIRAHWKVMLVVMTSAISLWVILIIKYWGKIKNVVRVVIDFIRDHWKLLLSILTGGMGALAIFLITHWKTIRDVVVAVFNKIKDIAKTVFGKVKDFVVAVKDKLDPLVQLAKDFFNAIKDGIDKVQHPLKTFVDLVGKVYGFFKKGAGAVGGFFSKVGSSVTGDGVIGAGLGAFMGAGGPGSISPTLFDDLALAQASGLTLRSGYRPGAVTSTGNPSLHGVFPSKAIDVAGSEAAMRRFFLLEVARGALTGLREIIHSPYWWHPGSGVTAIPASAGTVLADHYNHVHVGSYDRGGFLRPGWNLAYNGLGRPEPVGGGFTVNYYTTVGDPRDGEKIVRILEEWQRRGGRLP
jgi:TP901 family phage tail tape measure protein